MLILSFPKYSSAGATLQRGAAFATFLAFLAGAVFAAVFVAGGWAALVAGVVVDGTAAVVAAATSETQAIRRFTPGVLLMVAVLCELREQRYPSRPRAWRP